MSSYRSQLLQQWEGTVQDVKNRSFVAYLRDLTDPNTAEEQATFDFDEVSDDDQNLIAEGAVFYWSIGYRVESHGQKILLSTIRFRRLPAWTAGEIARTEANASKFDSLFGNER